MKDPTPYPAINTMLTEWVEGAKRLLGKNIVGMYLSGSLAYGDFVPERSDIDLEAVVRSPLTQEELRSVEYLHREIERRCPRWAGRVEYYLLSQHGIALDGPAFNELMTRIEIRDVRQASARDLFQEWVPKIYDGAWLSNSHNQSYLVLNLCRILHTVTQGEPRSKKIAAQWAKAAYPQWQNLIEEAEKWAYGDEMKRQADAVAFLQFAVERVNETKLLL